MMDAQNKRETLASRMGFILLSAGCAIGIGNVWRFPYITGLYGGGAFVLCYFIFLIILGLPVMIMEFSIGRASQQNIGAALKKLEPAGTKWHIYGYAAIAGNYLLMMFYTTVSGWMFAWLYFMAKGVFTGMGPNETGAFFNTVLSQPGTQVFWMIVSVIIGFSVCAIGLRKGVERITKIMMSALFVIMLILVIRSLTLPGAGEGLAFYLKPNFARARENGLWQMIYAAMGQAFFTLSLGIGSMAIFGSYINKENRLTGEAVNVVILDTLVALMAGLIIFPASFAFGVNPGAGPGLIFVTLPNIFNNMPAGRLWGTLFFIFMSFAALSTVVAVFENIVSFAIDRFGWSRKKSSLVNIFLMIVLSLPCALGFNLLSFIQPLGEGSGILDLEDFIVSNNLLPLGSMIFVFFCCYKKGWGWDNFIEEANVGKGLKFPVWIKPYTKYVLPLIILVIFIFGYIEKFF
ncbi:sodium-dependent transporter [Treponema sp. OttesenSCG-928-L16]|nr:sodium-dependent transporter [Treponema sp. OttesenSCG-928-L16]